MALVACCDLADQQPAKHAVSAATANTTEIVFDLFAIATRLDGRAFAAPMGHCNDRTQRPGCTRDDASHHKSGHANRHPSSV
ncbi:hypothetical protein MHAE_15600 [Mycobacterium haemophilum DSM 44634]